MSGPVRDVTDSSGFFQLYLKRTHEFTDTTKGFYSVVGQYSGQEIFRIDRLYVPTVGNMNITDSLAARE